MISVSFGSRIKRVNTVKNLKNILYSVLAAVGCVLLTLLVLLVVALCIWPGEDEELPTWYAFVIFLLPVCLGAFCGGRYYKVKRDGVSIEQTKNTAVPSSAPGKVGNDELKPKTHEREIPRSKKAQENIANMLESNIRSNVNAMYSAATLTGFFCYYDNAINGLTELAKLNKVCYSTSAPNEREQLESELQLNLCNAIVRIKDETIRTIKGKYANSPEFQKKAVENFRNDINNVILRLSSGTLDVATRVADELQSLVDKMTLNNGSKKAGGVEYELTLVDLMDGHDFEYWCADVLSNCGFQNVIVTRGSGDQGVDVIGEKGGVKYAVQCKRYSSDLGNTPVQEVYSGKTFYHCHVAAVMTNRRFTAGAKKLAAETGTLLWDRDWLISYLKAKYSNE